MTTLATIRQAMTAFLAEAGIEALSAWPKEVWKGRKTPVAVVQVKEVEAGASGFQNYLGPVSYTHLDVYKRQTPLCPRKPGSGMSGPFRGPFTGGLCWGSGLRRKGWSMTSLRRAWCGRHRRNQRTGG